MKKPLLLFSVALLSLVGLFGGYGYLSYQWPGPLAESKTLYFKKGEGFRDITDTLAEERVISLAPLFKIQAIVTRQYNQFKPGEYFFPAGINPKSVMSMLVDGDIIIHKLTIPEGLTASEVARTLNEEPLLTGDIPAEIPEGSLLPETYYFARNDNRAEIIRRMQEGMAGVLTTLWKTRAEGLPFKAPEEALTLASIVEKETRLESERKRIARAFINRLEKGIKLQADPTTMYAIELVDGKLNRPLVSSDLKRDLPHNTYMIDGLPPTPITNPGRASIEAVLNPADGNELFFVANGEGGHYFAATLKEHNENVAKYREKLVTAKAKNAENNNQKAEAANETR